MHAPSALKLPKTPTRFPEEPQNNSVAQSNLGLAYRTGQGVTQDFQEALKWYRLAAEQGYAVAQANLGLMYMEGTGALQDFNEGRALN